MAHSGQLNLPAYRRPVAGADPQPEQARLHGFQGAAWPPGRPVLWL